MNLRPLLLTILIASVANAQSPLPEPTPQKLPRWRGFNLLENFHDEWANEPFKEQDFQLIEKLGFNFVRLPLDYRIWTRGRNRDQFNEVKLQRIDQAIAWGKKYSIHVCLNFHRAPGYTVASPPEPTDLWTDAKTQDLCALHWRTFARRYREVPNSHLSFNLFNEPDDSAGENFVPVVKKIVEAIRREDPDRLIISDGLKWGSRPVLELAGLNLAQATRGYAPFELTHYRASWAEGADRFPIPKWPNPRGNGWLFAATKEDAPANRRGPMVITSDFKEPTVLRLRVDTVSSDSVLAARIDGRPTFEKRFRPGPGEGEWKKAQFMKQWNTYQNVYDRDYYVRIPEGTRRVEVEVTQGDWVSISAIGLRPDDQPDSEQALSLQMDWDQPTAAIRFQPENPRVPFVTNQMEDNDWLVKTTIQPWVAAQRRGIGVIVGEFGVYHRTPHDVTLAWMEDALKSWKQAGFGWALWNFRGDFGVLDSGRSDVKYERYEGHKLDRKMLELLQRY